VITWTLLDRCRITPIPPGHWLLVQHEVPFRAALQIDGGAPTQNVESIPAGDAHSACFPPRQTAVDVTKRDDIANALALLEDKSIDILVNNAGYLGSYRPFEQFDQEEWQKILQVNLLGTFEVTHQVLPIMRRAGKGRIVNTGSLAGKEGLPSLAAYSAASAGVIAFTKALSREVSDTGIRVNCIASGPIDTRMIRDLGNETVDAMITASPLGRLGDPAEVAALVAWLCSDASAFNTGAIFDMSGGRARY